MSSSVLYELTGRICRITLNRPGKRNALNADMVLELGAAFEQAFAESECRVILLSAIGDAFCSGADLDELRSLQSRSFEENLADSRSLMALYRQIHFSPKPVIALVNGPALAGGCGLVLCCDLCYCSPGSSFGFPEVRIGFMPALVSVFLVRRIGPSRARELLITGRVIQAGEAAQTGLVTAVVPADNLGTHGETIAGELATRVSPAAVRRTRELLKAAEGLSMEDALDLAATWNAETRSSEDCKKGVTAFLHKEKPQW